jgi:hypothetical protein
MNKYEGLVGKKFGRWTIIKEGFPFKNANGYNVKTFECICKCGTIRNVLKHSLFYNLSKSCGCLTKDNSFKKIFKGIGVSGFNRLKCNYKKNAKKRNHEFTLNDEQLSILFKGNCYYCGIEPNFIQKTSGTNQKGNYIYNGIDRKDNKIGYIIDNCVSCCKVCNEMKMDRTEDEFLNKIKQIYEKSSDRSFRKRTIRSDSK